MTITFPYVDLIEILGAEKITWDIEEFKEHDVQGSGHDLERKLAESKWKAAVVSRELYNDLARKIAAIIRKADGRALMVYDPSNPYPAADPQGVVLGASAVQVNLVGVDGASLSLKGLPAGYKLTTGDKGQIVFASGAANYFFEFSEDQTANGSGITIAGDVWPPIPIGIVEDATVILAKPKCKMKVVKNGFSPGQSSGVMTFGTTVSLMETI